MQRAATDNDAEQLVAGARCLGASSAYLGADSLSALCKHIETVAAEDGSDDLSKLVATLQRKYESVTEQLNTIIRMA